MMTTKEQRTSNRFPLCCTVFIKNKGRGLSRDISPSGIYFFTQDELNTNEIVSLIIHPHKNSIIYCDGEVVRKQNNSKGYGVAVHFTDVAFNAVH